MAFHVGVFSAGVMKIIPPTHLSDALANLRKKQPIETICTNEEDGKKMNNWIFAGAVDCVCVHCGYSERVPMRDGVAYFKHICRTVPPDLTSAKPVAKPEWHKFTERKSKRGRK